MSVKFKPLADRVLVEPAPAEQKTASGIIIPDTAKEKPLKGKVLAVGGGKKDEPMNLKVGDVVLYGQYAGTEIKLDGHSYLIMREYSIKTKNEINHGKRHIIRHRRTRKAEKRS